MRLILLLLLPAVITARKYPMAPGYYPPDEMKTNVPTMPMNPYQTMMVQSAGVDDYQFYYEKDPKKAEVLPVAKPGGPPRYLDPGNLPVPPAVQVMGNQIEVFSAGSPPEASESTYEETPTTRPTYTYQKNNLEDPKISYPSLPAGPPSSKGPSNGDLGMNNSGTSTTNNSSPPKAPTYNEGSRDNPSMPVIRSEGPGYEQDPSYWSNAPVPAPSSPGQSPPPVPPPSPPGQSPPPVPPPSSSGQNSPPVPPPSSPGQSPPPVPPPSSSGQNSPPVPPPSSLGRNSDYGHNVPARVPHRPSTEPGLDTGNGYPSDYDDSASGPPGGPISGTGHVDPLLGGGSSTNHEGNYDKSSSSPYSRQNLGNNTSQRGLQGDNEKPSPGMDKFPLNEGFNPEDPHEGLLTSKEWPPGSFERLDRQQSGVGKTSGHPGERPPNGFDDNEADIGEGPNSLWGEQPNYGRSGSSLKSVVDSEFSKADSPCCPCCRSSTDQPDFDIGPGGTEISGSAHNSIRNNSGNSGSTAPFQRQQKQEVASKIRNIDYDDGNLDAENDPEGPEHGPNYNRGSHHSGSKGGSRQKEVKILGAGNDLVDEDDHSSNRNPSRLTNEEMLQTASSRTSSRRPGPNYISSAEEFDPPTAGHRSNYLSPERIPGSSGQRGSFGLPGNSGQPSGGGGPSVTYSSSSPSSTFGLPQPGGNAVGNPASLFGLPQPGGYAVGNPITSLGLPHPGGYAVGNPISSIGPPQPGGYPVGNGCPCAAPPLQPCCAPVQPCCIPAPPCCPPPPPIPCCPRPPVCCQPVCCPTTLVVCCPVITLPICLRACPACPCRRRMHRALRMKRSPGATGNCQQCTAAGQPKYSRAKRRTNCKSCSNNDNPLTSLLSHSAPSSSCSACQKSDTRSARVKRMGCLPCLNRKKREIEEEHHRRVKRTGCVPCLGRKKRSPIGGQNNCKQCSNLGQLFGRYKRSFGCRVCGRRKRETESHEEQSSSCPCANASQPSSLLLGRKKREVDLTYDSVFTCDKSCCDYTRCAEIRAKKRNALIRFLQRIR